MLTVIVTSTSFFDFSFLKLEFLVLRIINGFVTKKVHVSLSIVPCLQFMNEVRIDKWMWATRIFKTRTIAAEACKKNRVMINGVNVKPSRMIKVGEVIQVRKPPITFSFKVLDLTERRMGAKLVPDYLENVTTPDQYEILEMNRISGFVDRARGLGRPTKKDRRELEQFTDLGMMNDGFDFEFDFEEPEDEE